MYWIFFDHIDVHCSVGNLAPWPAIDKLIHLHAWVSIRFIMYDYAWFISPPPIYNNYHIHFLFLNPINCTYMVESTQMDIPVLVAWLDVNRQDVTRSDSGNKTCPVPNQKDLTVNGRMRYMVSFCSRSNSTLSSIGFQKNWLNTFLIEHSESPHAKCCTI